MTETDKSLTRRLRGEYPVGPILADGSPEFGWRQYDPERRFTAPIQFEAAARIEALEAQLAEATRPQIAVTSEMTERFEAWFVQNYPGPNTIIHNPRWHAPKVFRAALHCVSKDGAEKAIAEAERRGAERMRERAAAHAATVTGDVEIFGSIHALPLTEGGE